MTDQKRGSSDDNPQRQKNDGKNTTNANTNAHNASDPNNESESLTTRIQKSASGLARNAFRPSAPSGDAAHLLSDSTGKGVPSSASASSSALTSAERYRDTAAPSSSAARDYSNEHPVETFRSSSSSTTAPGGFQLPGLTEEEFQNTYGGDLSSDLGLEVGKGKGKSSAGNIQSELEPSLNLNQDLGPRSPALESNRPTLIPSDGDEVVSLLTSRTFDPEFPPQANEDPESEHVETDLSSTPPPLTHSEIQIIESFRRQIPESNSQQRSLNPLSLVPDIGSFLDTLPSSASATDPNTVQATSLRDEVLTSLPGAADWVSVEERYQDEVWGFLKPTLEAAAKEIEAKNKSGNPDSENEDGPAVKRLKMILKHMQH
ncbi:hypothetical protein BDV18DRAFT_48589 [Aspergillus unguis]